MIKIPIIYEDNHLLVVKKPPNILSQKDRTGDKDMLTLLKEDLKVRYKKPGNVYLGLVHRIDRPVGGVMVFAKTSKGAARLSEQIKNRQFIRSYLAIIHGHPLKAKDTLVHYLLKDQKTNIVSVVNKNTKGAQEAILDYKVLGCQKKLSVVKVNLRTGRPHQIRVQFSSIGHPLLGDRRYGPQLNRSSQPIGLWAYEVSFLHPISKEIMSFRALPHKEPWSQFDLYKRLRALDLKRDLSELEYKDLYLDL